MTQKERLVELIAKYDKLQLEEGKEDSYYYEHAADYLLSNGVIVPPCKVGDTVYTISSVCQLNKIPNIYDCSRCRDYRDGCVYHYKVTECIAPTYAWIVLNILEMEEPQYWLTREEAEQALKEKT